MPAAPVSAFTMKGMPTSPSITVGVLVGDLLVAGVVLVSARPAERGVLGLIAEAGNGRDDMLLLVLLLLAGPNMLLLPLLNTDSCADDPEPVVNPKVEGVASNQGKPSLGRRNVAVEKLGAAIECCSRSG